MTVESCSAAMNANVRGKRHPQLAADLRAILACALDKAGELRLYTELWRAGCMRDDPWLRGTVKLMHDLGLDKRE